MRILTIKRGWLSDSDLRLDAEYHLSEGPITKRIIKRSPFKISSLRKVTENIFSGKIFKRTYVDIPKYGLPYLTASDMVKSDQTPDTYLSKRLTANKTELMIQPGWILLSCSGTLGNTVFTNGNFSGKVGTHDLIRIVPNSKEVKPGFLYAYLASKHGYSLLVQASYGGVIKHIEPHHIENLPVPLFPMETQAIIDKKIAKASALRESATLLVSEANEIIISYLEKIKTKNTNYELIKVSSIDKNQLRFDPPVYISGGVRRINYLRKKGFKFKTVKQLGVEITRPGIFKRSFTKSEFGIPYIPGSETMNINPFARCKYVSKRRTPFQNELRLKKDQILVLSAGSSSVGKVKLITKEYDDLKALGSQDIIRLHPSKNILYGYLFAYLNLPMMFDYLRSYKYGSAIERLEPLHIEEIPILIPEKRIEQTVHDKIVEYQEKIYKAFLLEKEATELIEKEIESWQK